MKKWLSVILAAAMLSTGAAVAEDTAALTFTPGTYEAEAQGIRSTVKLAVTFSENAITDITILEHGESRNIADVALEKVPQAILDTQSLNVDVITSATFTSRAVINAVTDACKQAGGNMDALKAKRDVKAEDAEVTADVVVVGTGLAGLSAAMSAVDAGAKVVAVEKAGAVGGSSKYSGGFITAVGSKQQQEVGYTLDVDGYMDYFNMCEDQSVKADETDRDAVRAMIERSAEDLAFLEAHGAPIAGPTGFGGDFTVWHYPADRTGPFDGDAAGADHIVHALDWLVKQEGFEIYYNTPATKILTDETGAACGVVCQRKDGSTLTVRADSVILASGGWAASREMMERFCPDFPQQWVLPYTTSTTLQP